jgi:hypothetical protein
MMAKLCAPVRDDEIADLRKIKEVVPLFQGILKTMDHMKQVKKSLDKPANVISYSFRCMYLLLPS